MKNALASLLIVLSAAHLGCLLFNSVTRAQANKPGGKDPTVIWWTKGSPIACKHSTNCSAAPSTR